MIIIHATKKLLSKLKVLPEKNPSVNSGSLGPWYADVKIIDRKHIVIALNERSLLCVVVPWATFKADPAGSIRIALRPVLEAIGLPDEVIVTELSAFDTATITTTASRVTLGRLNIAAADAGYQSFHGESLIDISVRMASRYYIVGKGQRDSGAPLVPYQIVGDLFGVPTRSTESIAMNAPSLLTFMVPDRSKSLVEKKPILTGVIVLRIVLDGILPEIWRTIVVPETITLRRLHDVIQAAMGWDEMHLHLYHIRGKHYGDHDVFDLLELKEERSTSLQSLRLSKGDTFNYLYDMGDNWSHTITVLEKAEVEPDDTFHVLDGANAAPPEDVGGVYGYAQFVLAMMDPKHENHEAIMEWHGRAFDHTMFDLRTAQRLLSVLIYSGAGYPWKKPKQMG